MKHCFLVIAFALASHFAFSQSDIAREPESLLNKPLPQFAGTSLKQIHWNNEKLKAKVALIAFWYMGCPPCMQEINYLNKLQREYKDKDFILISIVPQLREDLIEFNDSIHGNTYSRIRKGFKAKPIEYEIIPVCDTRKYIRAGQDTSIGVECDNVIKDFYVEGFPTTFIVDKAGIIRYMNEGFNVGDENASEDTIRRYREIIDELLE